MTFRVRFGRSVRRFSRGDSAAVDAALPLAVSYEHAAIISAATVSKNEAVTDSDGVVAPALLTPTELAQASGLREDLIARFIPAALIPPALAPRCCTPARRAATGNRPPPGTG
jgi:hypothetical protein